MKKIFYILIALVYFYGVIWNSQKSDSSKYLSDSDNHVPEVEDNFTHIQGKNEEDLFTQSQIEEDGLWRDENGSWRSRTGEWIFDSESFEWIIYDELSKTEHESNLYKDTQANKRLKYNVYEDKWEYAEDGETIKYNVYEDKWEYVGEDEKIRYNAMEDSWDHVSEDETLNYNSFEDTWEYTSNDESLQYNSFEDTWEYAEDGESLQYNVLEDKWSYE